MHKENSLALAEERGRAQGAGCRFSEQKRGLCEIGRLEVSTGQKGLSPGRYLSLRFPAPSTLAEDGEWEISSTLAELLSTEYRRLVGTLDATARVLVAGLGNPRACADSLGPLTVSHIRPTAQLPHELRRGLGAPALSVFAPLVCSLTGIDSVALLRAAVKAFSPSLVLLLDATVTESTERLGRCLQLTDTGISPGSGVGDAGVRLDAAALGLPTLALGCPTVLDAKPLFVRSQRQLAKEFAYLLPRDADTLYGQLSRILARAVEGAFGLSAGA